MSSSFLGFERRVSASVGGSISQDGRGRTSARLSAYQQAIRLDSFHVPCDLCGLRGVGLCQLQSTRSGAGSTLGSKPPPPSICARFIIRRFVALFLASRGPGARPTCRLGTLPCAKRCIALSSTSSLIQMWSLRMSRRSGRQQTCLLKDMWSIN